MAQAMRDEIAVMYDGLDLDGDSMFAAGAAELGPPGGAFVVGYHEGRPGRETTPVSRRQRLEHPDL